MRRKLHLKERILRTAARLFAKKSYETTRMDEIARQLRITKPTIYYYYDSKRQLYKMALQYYMDKVFDSDNKDSETARMELAKGIGLMDAKSSLVEKLEDLIEDNSLDVSRYAMESAAKLKLREYLPQIIEKLKNPQTKADSSAALVKYGTKIIGTLSDYMSADDEDLDVKSSVISILAQIGNQETADLLSLELNHKKDEIDKEIIDALDKIRSENSNIQFSEEIILPEILKRMKDQFSAFLEWFETEVSSDEEDKTGKRSGVYEIIHVDIFKLLGLLYPHEDIIKAYQNIEFGTKDSIGYAIELANPDAWVLDDCPLVGIKFRRSKKIGVISDLYMTDHFGARFQRDPGEPLSQSPYLQGPC